MKPTGWLPCTRRELVLLGVVALAGLALRCGFLSRAAVEHFDEGVYSSNIWFQGGYPFRHLFAPPLHMGLMEWSIRLLGSGHFGTMAVNLLYGSATVVLVWWVVRSWFGPAAGLCSATLAALSEFHIAFSRTALTDPGLGFWMLAAVYFIWEALRRQSYVWGLPAGAATALAWWTKYNGWLPLVVGLAGTVPWLLFHRPRLASWAKSLGIWLLIALMAFALWSPVLSGLQDVGGYAAVEANHRGYFVGFPGWTDSFSKQYLAQRHFNGWFSIASVGLAVLVFGIGTSVGQPGTARSRASLCRAAALALFGSAVAAIIGTSATLALLTLLCVVVVWRERITHDESDESKFSASGRSLAGWLTLAWFIGLIASAPLYRAYPRLTLPWLISTWLGAGMLIEFGYRKLVNRRNELPLDTTAPMPARPALPFAILAIAAAVGLVLFNPSSRPSTGSAWQDRTELEEVAKQIVQDSSVAREVGSGNVAGRMFFVFGEPAIIYHLSAGNELAVPIADLGLIGKATSTPRANAYLVTGPHAERSGNFASELQRSLDRIELIGEYDVTPSDLVLLDEFPASQLEDASFNRNQQIRVYRLK